MYTFVKLESETIILQ